MTTYAPYKIPDYLKPLLEEQARIGRYELEWEGIDSNYLDRGFGCSPFHGIPRDYDTPNEYMERKKRYEEIEEEIDRLQEEHGEWYRDQFKDSWKDLFKSVIKDLQSNTCVTEEEQILAKSNRKKDADKQFKLARYYESKEGKDRWDKRSNIEKSVFFDIKAAKNGNAEAQYELARILLHIGFVDIVQKDNITGMFWLQKAAEQNNVKAQQLLARILSRSRNKDDYEIAVYWMEQAANQGKAGAQNELANFYMEGIVVEKDIEKAVYWHQKAAEQGYAYSSRELARHYCSKNDKEKALYWYKKAVEQGGGLIADEFKEDFGEDAYFLGYITGNLTLELAEFYEKENAADEIVIQYYKKAIEAGNDSAKFKLAKYYQNKGDKEEAYKWFKTAAKSGNKDAMFIMAQYCEREIDEDEKKNEKTIYWYKKAMENGHKQASFELARFYEKLAFDCYQDAYEHGNAEASMKMAQYCEMGIGWLNRYDVVFEHYLDAGFLGNVEGQFKAAEYFENGNYYYDYKYASLLEGKNRNPKPNKERAFAWYLTAAENGHTEAQFRVAKCYKTGYGTDKNEEKAAYWYEKANDSMKKEKLIFSLDLTDKTEDRLIDAGIKTVGDFLLYLSHKNVEEQKHLPKRIVEEVVKKLKAAGFSLYGEKSDKHE